MTGTEYKGNYSAGKVLGDPVETVVIAGEDLFEARTALERIRGLIAEGDEAREEALRLLDTFSVVNFKYLI